MGKRNIFAERRKTDQQGEDWFNRIDDNIPFEAFADQQEKNHLGEEMLIGIRRKIRTQKLFRIWRNVAAAVFVLISTGTFTYRTYLAPTSLSTEQSWESYVAGKGEFKKIELPDHSVIHLRPGSRVFVPRPFVQKVRQIRLEEGEIYFDVSHDASHPFLVKTAQLTTEVLGTRFIISNDLSAKDIRVALLEGKVAVRTRTSKLAVLYPNQQLSFNKLKATAKLENVPTNLNENWLNGEYMLDNVPLKDFARTFGNVFALNVRFSQEDLKGLHVSIQFNRTDNPITILDQLKLIHGLKYQIRDKEVILMK